MPVTKSAQRALRKNLKRRKLNLQKKNQIKKLIKKIRALVAEKKNAEAKALLPQIYKLLDKAAKTGLIKKNTASRKKSRLTQLINKAQ